MSALDIFVIVLLGGGAIIGFVRGLEASLAVSGEPGVVIVHARGAAENVENSTVAGRTPALLASSMRLRAVRMAASLPSGGPAATRSSTGLDHRT